MPFSSTGNLRRIVGLMNQWDLTQILQKIPTNIGKYADACKNFREYNPYMSCSSNRIPQQHLASEEAEKVNEAPEIKKKIAAAMGKNQ